MRHMDNGELVRYVDGELAQAEARRWEAHMASCPRCSREIDAVRSESGRLSDWLSLADFEADLDRAAPPFAAPALTLADTGAPAPAARTTDTVRPVAVDPADAAPPAAAPPTSGVAHTARKGDGGSAVRTAWLKAAIIVLLVAAPLAAFPGVRGWVVERMSPDGGAVSETFPAAVLASPVIRFEPAAGSFTVRLPGPTEGGILTLERTESDAAVEAVLRIEGTAEPVVAERVLRILDAEPGTRFSLSLPPAVTDIRVLMGDVEIPVDGDEIDAGLTLPLDG
ncbi:MAG TPA: zf-HC2 domain-containing protein [Longimicrobiales bacterium]|nr:zf-HC2 domain-containing protein [Longimicrobiales bacterium]